MWKYYSNDNNEVKEKNLVVSEDPKIIETVRNRIYFYADITTEAVLQLNKRIREMDNEHIIDAQFSSTNVLMPIYLHINSRGGLIIAGLSAMDNLLLIKSPLVTIIDGICASAATFLSIVGKERYITKHSVALIHQLSGACWGNFEQMRDDMQNAEMLMETLKKVYLQYTKIPKSKLVEILKHDLLFDSQTALKYGLVDKII